MKNLLLFLFIGNISFAQSLTGTRGLMKSPNARMYENNTISVGASYVPPGLFKRTYGIGQGLATGNAGLNTFVTVNLLPFVEVMFRYTHELNMKVSPLTRYFPDRMLTARFKVLNETKKLPAIVIGFQDLSAAFDLSCESCANFSSNYIVATKQLLLKNGYKIDATLGLGGGLKNLEAKEFKGVFGGVEIFTPFKENISLLIDYDSENLNFGINGYFLKKIHFTAGMLDYNRFSWILAYRYQI